MPFDPNQPYEVVSAPQFDPSQPFEPVEPEGLTAAEILKAAGEGIAETYGPHALADDAKRLARGAVRGTGQALAGMARLNQRLQDTLVDLNPLVPSADQEAALRKKLGEADNPAPTVAARMKSENAAGAAPAVSAGKAIEDLGNYYQPDPARNGTVTGAAAELLGNAAPIVAAGPFAPAAGGGMIGEQVREGAIAAGDTPDVADAKATIGAIGGGALGMLPGGELLSRVVTPRLAVVAPATAAALQIGGDAALGGAGGVAFDAGYQQLVNGQVDWRQALKTGGLVAFIGGIGGALKANAAQKLAAADREGLMQAARPLGFEGKTFADLQQWYDEHKSAAEILAGGKQQNARPAAEAEDAGVPGPTHEAQAPEITNAPATGAPEKPATAAVVPPDEAALVTTTAEASPSTDVSPSPASVAPDIPREIATTPSTGATTPVPAFNPDRPFEAVPTSAAPSEGGAKSEFDAYVAKAFQRAVDEDRGQAILDSMTESGRSPRQVVGEFWADTYPVLPEAQQKRFQRYIRRESGLEPGDVIATRKTEQGTEVFRANDWSDIYPATDVPDLAEHLEGTERGLVALMETANAIRRQAPVPPQINGGALELADPANATPNEQTAPDVVSMPTPPPGTPVARIQNRRMLVAMEPIVAGGVDVPTVMQSYEDVVRAVGGNAPIRTGRFNQKANGIYKTFADVIRLRQADNLPTAAHEVAHAISKQLFGGATSRDLVAAVRNLQPVAKTAAPINAQKAVQELTTLGRQLYGGQNPAAGYQAEGFSELLRLWLTTENAAKAAPEATRWLEEAILPANPPLAAALKRARDLTDVWRGQGAAQRAEQMMKDPEGRLARLKKVAEQYLSRRAMVEEFAPLEELANGFAETTGRKLKPHEDPFLLASAKRGAAGQVLDTWVQRGMTDVWGNLTGPSLKEALAPIKPNEATDFAKYLWSRRAIERWRKGQNPGLALEDAQYLRSKLETPAFIAAAQKYYAWWDGALEYVKQASPEMNGGLVDAIRASSKDYVPLARVIDEQAARARIAGQTGAGLYKFHGSGRPIRNIWLQSLLVAEKLIQRAHKDMVLDSVFRLSRTEGMGWLVEKVPLTRVMQSVNIEKLRSELESHGVDTSGIPADTLLTYATHLDKPSGADPIMVRRTANGPEWYQVPAAVYESLEGIAPPRLGAVADLFLGMPARMFKLGTTGLRASFSVVTNPVRDWPNFMLQSIGGNPAQRTVAYFKALHDVLRSGLTGKESPEWKVFHQLAVSGGNFLGGDIHHAQRSAKALFRGRYYRRIASPIETLREALSFSESAPRLAELSLVGRDFGWQPGKPMTPEQAVAMALAAKRVTTDFSAGGSVAKVVNQAIPFFNANIQGTRAFLRSFKTDQGIKQINGRWLSTVLKGLALLTLPVVWNWWRNKDRDWYKFLPWRERYLYTNVEDAHGNIWQVPRPQEAGNLFMVMPEMLLDTWYRRDPEAVTQGLQHMFALQNPVDYPVLLRVAKEQWQNRIEFFDRPIIPRGQIDLPPGEQRSPYTTALADALGDAFPNQVSPRRVDSAIRSLFGGVGGDLVATPDMLMQQLGLRQANQPQRESEPSDLPIFGRLLRRGGGYTANAQPLVNFWDDFTRYQSRWQAQQAALKQGRSPILPLQADEFAYYYQLHNWEPVIKLELQIADRTPELGARQKLYQRAAQQAASVLAHRPAADR